MLVLGHRGASVAARENTPAAFRAADRMGADGVELDVRLARGDRLVVRHDPLPEPHDPVDPVEPGDPVEPVELDAALDSCGSRMLVNIEVKNLETEPDFDPDARVIDRVLEVLDRRGADEAHRWLVSSFSWTTLERCRARAPAVPTAWLVLDATADVVERVAAAGDVALHPWVESLTAEAVARCHRAGLAVHTWTCDDPARIAELAAIGVDGVCTDVPDVALAALGRTLRAGVSPRWGRPA